MRPLPAPRRHLQPARAAGAALLVLGLVALAVAYVPVPGLDLAHYGWPLIVVLAGLLLIGLGAALDGASGLALPGGVVTAAGLVLAAQTALGAYQTWAYAWPLVVPGGVGVGLLAQGLIRRSPRELRAGRRLLETALLLFAVLAAFFEGVIHLSHWDFGPYGRLVLPVALIAAGAALILRRPRR